MPAFDAEVCGVHQQQWVSGSLELHKIYRVVSDEEATRQGDLRVVDESGEDYLYPAAWFVPLGLPPRVKGVAASPQTSLSSLPRRKMTKEPHFYVARKLAGTFSGTPATSGVDP